MHKDSFLLLLLVTVILAVILIFVFPSDSQKTESETTVLNEQEKGIVQSILLLNTGTNVVSEEELSRLTAQKKYEDLFVHLNDFCSTSNADIEQIIKIQKAYENIVVLVQYTEPSMLEKIRVEQKRVNEASAGFSYSKMKYINRCISQTY